MNSWILGDPLPSSPDSFKWVHGRVQSVLPGPAGSPVGTGKGVSGLRPWPWSWPPLVFFLLFVFVPPFVPVSVSVSISVSLSVPLSVSLSVPLSVPLSFSVFVSVSVSGWSSGGSVGGWGGRAGWGLPAAMGSLGLRGGSLILRIYRRCRGHLRRCRVRQNREGFLHLETKDVQDRTESKYISEGSVLTDTFGGWTFSF